MEANLCDIRPSKGIANIINANEDREKTVIATPFGSRRFGGQDLIELGDLVDNRENRRLEWRHKLAIDCCSARRKVESFGVRDVVGATQEVHPVGPI